jgi:hypothetical protein
MDPTFTEDVFVVDSDGQVDVVKVVEKPLDEERRLLHNELVDARSTLAKLTIVGHYDATEVEGQGLTIGRHLYGAAPKRTVVKGGDVKHTQALAATRARINLLEELEADWESRLDAWEAANAKSSEAVPA